MGRRLLLPLAAGCLAAALVLGARTGTSWLPTVEPGSESPAIWKEGQDADLLVGWVFRAKDCLSCSTPTSALRRLQAKYGDRLEIAAVGVGADSSEIRSFLRRERLRVRLTLVDELTYRRQFGWSPTPALYVVRGGGIVAVAERADRTGSQAAGGGGLEAVVSRIMQEP